MKRAAICAVVSLATVEASLADDKPDACLRSALDSHIEARQTLLDTAQPVMSPDAQIMRRRLDEKYCLEVTACGLQGQGDDTKAMMANALFSSCLKEVSQ
ncbi:hypothetical protein [Rhizobium leguminosarum]|uniref:hypothetical protein n=1 Tax=Rhizobium leguminosarum TaxID=384 RepID=UPI003F9DEEC3